MEELTAWLYGKRRAMAIAVGILLMAVAVVQGGRSFLAGRRTREGNGLATARVRRGELVVTVSGSGQVVPRDRRSIQPGVTGTVEKVVVQPGQRVKAGDLLMTLSNDALLTQLEQARSSLKGAEVQLAETLGLPVSRALTARVGSTLTVVAPADGVVSWLKAAPGDRVSQGATLGIIVSNRELIFVADVTRSEAGSLAPDQEVRVRLDQFDGDIRGVVTSVAGEGRPGDTTIWYQVRISLPNPGLLKEGMAGTVIFLTGNGEVSRRGVTEWSSRNLVQSTVAGTIEEILVQDGEVVNNGQPLLRLRNDTLPDQVESQRARVRQAMAEVAQKEEEAGKLAVRSPVGGRILSVVVKPGDQVSAGTEVAVVGDLDRLVVTAAVDELDVSKVQEGQRATVTFEALPGREFQGTVTSIALEGTAKSGVTTYDVEVELPRDPAIRPGMTASVAIEVARKEGVLLIPVEAVSRQMVRVMAGGRAEPRRVQLGLQNNAEAEVVSGLQEGELLVLAAPDTGQGAGFRFLGGFGRMPSPQQERRQGPPGQGPGR